MQRLLESLRRVKIIRAASEYLSYLRYRYQLWRALKGKTPAIIFRQIYQKNIWGDKESLSGPGSTLRYTEGLRKNLTILLNKFSIRTLYDAPCGDFNWMQHVISDKEINYLGADIVEGLIQLNKNKFQNDQRKFMVADITQDPFPKADLWFCRDCFPHFSYKDIYLALSNFVKSEILYILTSTYTNNSSFKNINTDTGNYRLLDLFSEPFNFPRDVYFIVDDYIDPFPPRQMCLFSRKQIAGILPTMSKKINL